MEGLAKDNLALKIELEIEKLKFELEGERLKLDFERGKLEIQHKQLLFQKTTEENKLAIERKRLLYSSALGIIPLVAVIATIFYGIWTQRQTEKTTFQIKAAELMFNSADAYELKLNGEILKKLFPDKLPENFASTFEPDSVGYDSYIVNSKKDLLKMISANSDKRNEIVANWKAVFPSDAWVDTLILE